MTEAEAAIVGENAFDGVSVMKSVAEGTGAGVATVVETA